MSKPDHNKAVVSTETIKRTIIKASQSRGQSTPKTLIRHFTGLATVD
jgi:hypothetical protein